MSLLFYCSAIAALEDPCPSFCSCYHYDDYYYYHYYYYYPNSFGGLTIQSPSIVFYGEGEAFTIYDGILNANGWKVCPGPVLALSST